MRTILEVLLALIIFENLKILWRALQHLWRHRSADREPDEYIQRLQRKLEDDRVLAEMLPVHKVVSITEAQKCSSLKASTYSGKRK